MIQTQRVKQLNNITPLLIGVRCSTVSDWHRNSYSLYCGESFSLIFLESGCTVNSEKYTESSKQLKEVIRRKRLIENQKITTFIMTMHNHTHTHTFVFGNKSVNYASQCSLPPTTNIEPSNFHPHSVQWSLWGLQFSDMMRWKWPNFFEENSSTRFANGDVSGGKCIAWDGECIV